MPTKGRGFVGVYKSGFNRGLEGSSAHTEGNTRPASHIRRLRQQKSGFGLFHPGDLDAKPARPT